ncbi:MAG: hypothetical protein Q8Q09_18565 [Deltaproteobacteria bacterium]|nr:hypothetical protein [Deltaproteobacteria bacterium]
MNAATRILSKSWPLTFALALGASSMGCGGSSAVTIVITESELSGTVMWNGTYEIRNSLTIRGPLTLAPCTRVRVAADVTISVRDRGSIRALGTAACPVQFESANPTPSAGDWGRIDIYSSASNDTLFQHTRISHGNGGTYGVVWVEDRATVGMDNVRFVQSRNRSIQVEAEGRVSTFANVSFESVDGELMKVPPVVIASLSPVTTVTTTNPRIVLDGSTMTGAAMWRNLGVSLEIPTTAIEAGAVEIAAGSVLRMLPEAVITVRNRGALRMLGTATQPVVIESAKATQAPGDWRRIDFTSTSESTNLLRNTTVRHGGDSTYGVLWVDTGATLALESTTLSMNSSCDVGGEGTVNMTTSMFMRCAR